MDFSDTAVRPLRFHGVSAYASADTETPFCLMEDVDLTVHPGEWLNIAGVNGSGKSTLARLLAGLHADGVTGVIDRGFAGNLPSPMVLQRPESQLFGETPREEVRFALEWREVAPDRHDALADEALRRAGLLELADHPWEMLSGGQRQLAAAAAVMASAMAGGCGLMVFDEATSMLDDAHRQVVMGMARTLQRQGIAVIWVTQRLDELEPDDRVLAMKDGRVVYDGDVRSFFSGNTPDGITPCEACGLRLPYRGERFVHSGCRDHGTGSVAGSNQDMLIVEGLRLQDHRRRHAGEANAGPQNLQLAPGTLTLILGANGAGKTVFLEKLAGLRDPEGLAIRYGDEPLWIRKRAGKGMRRNPRALPAYGYASQAPEEGLFLRSLDKELAFSLRPYAGSLDPATRDERIRQALAAVGWEEAWLKRDPRHMSGGERRRAALAALFVTPASWLLLDEPTAGLDREGQNRLAEHLTRLKKEDRGIVLVSHEMDWAMPLADQVLLMQPDGQMHLCTPEQLIAHPHVLERAGMMAPVRIKADLGHMREAKADMPRRNQKPATHPLTRFDPRSVWLGYILLSIGIFTVTTWAGLLAAALTVLALMGLGRIPMRRWRGLFLGFVMFGAGFAALNAVRFTAPGDGPGIMWEAPLFFQTLLPFARTLTVLALGLGLPLIWTPLMVRRALEQLGARQGRVPALWQRQVLIITLTLRFIPVLLREWERFGRIYLARGKETKRGPAALLRRLQGSLLPLLYSLIRLADETAAALESRGVRRDARRVIIFRLRWAYRDYAIVAAAALIAACFVLMA